MGSKHDQIDRTGVEGHLAVYRSWPYSTTYEAFPSHPALHGPLFFPSAPVPLVSKPTYLDHSVIIHVQVCVLRIVRSRITSGRQDA